jgi:hypothetical protein
VTAVDGGKTDGMANLCCSAASVRPDYASRCSPAELVPVEAVLDRNSDILGVRFEPQRFGKSGSPNLRNSRLQIHHPVSQAKGEWAAVG